MLYRVMLYPVRKVVISILVGVLLLGLSMAFVDQSLSQFFKRPDLEPLWLAARNVTNIGLSQHYFLIAIFTYIFAKWVRPQFTRTRVFGRDLFFALVGSGILVHVFKFCVGRQRPHLSENFEPWTFHPFTTDWNYQSFASGHAQVLFTVATVLSLTWPRGTWGFYLLAAVFGFTRVIVHDHFLSDVIGGAVIGYVGAVTSVYLLRRRLDLRHNLPYAK
jgi:membrane-associated phospholipid phosphatase